MGEGVASHEGRTVFIPGAFPGDTVLASIDESAKVLRGEVLKLEKKSKDRRKVEQKCDGCDWLELNEKAQLPAKEEIVRSSLEHLGSIPRDAYALRTSVPSPSPLGYRRRAVLHTASENGEFRLGFFGRGTHERIPLTKCPAMAKPLLELARLIEAPLAGIGRDIDTVTLLSEGDETALSVQLTTLPKPRHEDAVQAAMRRGRSRGAVLVPSEGPSRLYGKPVLKALSPLHPHVPLFLRPDGFAQANAEANHALVTAAVYELAPTENDRVLELYSGNGNFSFAVALVAKELVAIESSPVGVELSQRSAREGAVSNIRFMQGDSFKVARNLAAEGRQFDLILVDPPRTGAQGIADLALELGVRRVVYVACDPAALARDAGDLRALGFQPLALQLVDMFPQTHHVEAVMSFEREN